MNRKLTGLRSARSIIVSAALIAALSVAALYLSCASAPPPASRPAWAASPNGIRAVYPDSAYIAQEGRGQTRQAAETDGAAQIARFFNTQIRSSVSARERSREQNGAFESTREIETETFVDSQMSVFGIRYAADAYYEAGQGEWITVAYIDRAEAWQVYGPRFKKQADAFMALYRAAETENSGTPPDPFKQVLGFMSAESFSRTPEFENAEVFGQLLYPARMNAEFAVVREAAAELPQKLDSARKSAGVYIDCPVDFESRISNAFTARLSALGFPVAKTRNAAAAICAVTVDEGMQRRDIGTFYNPSLQAVISGSSGPLFTFSAQGERAAAATPDVAKRRAYQSLAEQVRQTFSLRE